MSKKIPLTQDKFAIVDNKNYKRFNKWKWQLDKSNNNTYYAIRVIKRKGIRKTISIHREVLGLKLGDGKQADHRNHNGLDNRECNLRICTKSQNQHNRLPNRNAKSKYKGVRKHAGKWQAGISIMGEQVSLGHFFSEIDAAKAYDKKAKELFGEFAYTNFQERKDEKSTNV